MRILKTLHQDPSWDIEELTNKVVENELRNFSIQKGWKIGQE